MPKNTVSLTLIYPSYLGKIKLIQNLLLIISGLTFLLAITLSFFHSEMIIEMENILFLIGFLSFIPFLIFAILFSLIKTTKTATISHGVISLEIQNQLNDFKLKNVTFLLNIKKSKSNRSENPLSELNSAVSTWGNYIIISYKNRNLKIQFMPDDDLLNIPELNIETYNRSILLNNTIDLFKYFIDILWSASLK
jgi:hypothetical protein